MTSRIDETKWRRSGSDSIGEWYYYQAGTIRDHSEFDNDNSNFEDECMTFYVKLPPFLGNYETYHRREDTTVLYFVFFFKTICCCVFFFQTV